MRWFGHFWGSFHGTVTRFMPMAGLPVSQVIAISLSVRLPRETPPATVPGSPAVNVQ